MRNKRHEADRYGESWTLDVGRWTLDVPAFPLCRRAIPGQERPIPDGQERPTSNVRRPTSNWFGQRRGLSLLEVLFSIFVLSVGLLGLAAMVPIGHFHNSQAADYDRAAACGRAGMREVETRDLLRWETWRTANGNQWPRSGMNAGGNNYPGGGAYRVRLDPFVIDPLFVADNGASSPGFPFDAQVEPKLQLPRITIAGLSSKLLADTVFTWRDDIKAAPPANDPEGRPLLMPDSPGGDNTLYTNDDVGVAIDGEYSWIAMITPSALENPAPGKPLLRLDQRRTFTVSIIVFRDRVTANIAGEPSERQLQSQVAGNNAILTDPTGTGNLMGNLRAGQWIMLSSFIKNSADPSDPRDVPEPRPLHRWYRIAAVGQPPEGNQRQAALRLTGPEWPGSWTVHDDDPNDGDFNPPARPIATVVNDVVGVYERVISLDRRSLESL